MKTDVLIIFLTGCILLTVGACKKYDGKKARQDRSQWIESLHDSISQIIKERSEDSIRIAGLRTEIESDLSRFTQVANQREVEPYYILTSARGRYPLASTGIMARITNGMQFELVAALSGQKFDAVRICLTENPQTNVTSSVIPPDQGLNYTSSDGLTVVAFSGTMNAPLGEFVSENLEAPLSVEYLMNGGVRKTLPITQNIKETIAATWHLTNSRTLLDSLENIQVINARKLEILHITLSRQSK